MELAEQQGVKPFTNIEDLYGDFWPEDESIDDFIATIRAWREESDSRELPPWHDSEEHQTEDPSTG